MAPESEQASSLHEGAQVEKGSFHPRQAAPALAADVVPVEGAWAVTTRAEDIVQTWPGTSTRLQAPVAGA